MGGSSAFPARSGQWNLVGKADDDLPNTAWIVVLAAVSVIVFALGCLFSYDTMRQERVAHSHKEAGRALAAFEAQATRLFDYGDGYLRAVRTYYQEHGGGEPFRHYLRTVRAPRAEAFTGIVTVVDRNGMTVFQSELPDDALKAFGSMADLDHFRFFKDHAGDRLFVGATRYGRVTGKYQFRIARPILTNGQFDGEVILTLLPEHLTSFFAELSLGPNSIATIATMDRKLIARHPMPAATDFDRPIAFAPQILDLQAPSSGTFRAASPVDSIVRQIFYKRLADYPVLMLVGIAEADVDAALAESRNNLGLLALIFAAAAAIVCLLVIRLYQQRHQLTRAERRALEANLQLEILSNCDGLTGLANRRRFDEALDMEWRRALRSGEPVSLIMLDVDHFKEFNDRYGHQGGDDCLRLIAGILAGSVMRGGDLTARYGGEEFAIILPITEQGEAVTVAERLRQGVEAGGMPHAGNPTGHVTISLGVAALVPHPSITQDRLIELADKALYRAKANGRNRTEQAEHQAGSNA